MGAVDFYIKYFKEEDFIEVKCLKYPFDLEMYKMLELRNLEQNYFDFLTSCGFRVEEN